MISFLLQVWGLAKPYRGRLLLGILAGAIGGLLEPLTIATITLVYSVVFPGADAPDLSERFRWAPTFVQTWAQEAQAALATGIQSRLAPVILLVAAIPAVIFLRGLFAYLNVYFLQWTAIRAITDLRIRLFSHLLNLSASFFNRTSSGELISRILSDTYALLGIVSNATGVFVKDPVTLVALLAWLLWQQPQLTLVSLVVLPVCVVPIAIYSRKVRRSSGALQEHAAKLTDVMGEAFTGNRIIKAYNLEGAVVGQFRDTSHKFVSHYMRIVRSSETPGPLLEFFGAIGVALVFLFLLSRTGGGSRSADFLNVILSIFAMYRPMKNLARLQSYLEQARAASLRVFELLATENTVPEPAAPRPLRAAGAEIHFDHVEFAYGDKTVLEGINLSVQAGQLVALVGASGSGKTTLTNLLLRFYDPQKGAVRVGGTDIRDVTTRDLRNQIAVVTQETILFNDTIRNNIALGRPGANNGEIEEAAKHAFAHEFILEKPQGYDTVVGEKGVTLSGGQRQRIAIARAILRNAPILILDEAMSALDTESERVVQAALEELMQSRTTICIAHRLSTVQKADLIVVLDQRRIVETGKHTELIKRGGVYQKLYELQFPA